jgi:hypothetical protein
MVILFPSIEKIIISLENKIISLECDYSWYGMGHTR